jgi:WD40 repeat protein
MLASASNDQTVRLWNPVDGSLEKVLTGHTRWVRGVCALRYRGVQALASASHDRTVRIWDPATGELWREIPVHHDALSLWSFGDDRIFVGLSAGLLAIHL